MKSSREKVPSPPVPRFAPGARGIQTLGPSRKESVAWARMRQRAKAVRHVFPNLSRVRPRLLNIAEILQKPFLQRDKSRGSSVRGREKVIPFFGQGEAGKGDGDDKRRPETVVSTESGTEGSNPAPSSSESTANLTPS